MKELKELFIKYLTEDINSNIASAIFNKETGIQLYGEVRIDMIIWALDEAMKDYSKLKK